MPPDGGARQLSALDLELELDGARPTHLTALLYRDAVSARSNAGVRRQNTCEGPAAEPVAGSSRIPRSGANIRARKRVEADFPSGQNR